MFCIWFSGRKTKQIELKTTNNKGFASGGFITKFNGNASIELLCKVEDFCFPAVGRDCPPSQSPEKLAVIANKQIHEAQLVFLLRGQG